MIIYINTYTNNNLWQIRTWSTIFSESSNQHVVCTVIIIYPHIDDENNGCIIQSVKPVDLI